MLYHTLIDNHESDDFEYRTLDNIRILYHKGKNMLQLFIPASEGFRELLLYKLKAYNIIGHLGVYKMMQALSTGVWWPSMLKTV